MSDSLKMVCAADVKIVHSDIAQQNAQTQEMIALLAAKGVSDGKELARFAISHSVRRVLPYGIWTCKDGREVVYNREYQPILQKKDGVASYADRGEWVKDIVETKYLYDDLNAPMLYLTKHLGQSRLSAAQSKACKKSLQICLQVLRDYSPKESNSVNRAYSLA